MLFSLNKSRDPSLKLSQLEAFSRLVRDYPPTSEHFLESLPYVFKLLGIESGSLYIYDGKNAVFLLKSWVGKKPLRFSLVADNEFLKFLKLRDALVSRDEFVKKSHELRQSALFFFQQTSSNKTVPVLEGENWLAILCLEESAATLKEGLLDEVLKIYLSLVRTWAIHDRVFQDYRKLSEFAQVKNELLGNVTHEFQTPLNGILGITEAILEGSDGVITPELKSHLEMIQKSGRQLHETLGNIIKLTQVEAKKGRAHLEKINLLSLVEEVVLLYQTVFEEKGNRCILPQKSARFEIFAEPDQIRTVFMNLIGNAVKFTQGGEVTIDMRKSGEMLHVSVADTGVGIEQEKLDLIFEEFFQADASRTRAHGGTGLGLALVKKIITLHGGRIWAESQTGVGTKISFTLPVLPG